MAMPPPPLISTGHGTLHYLQSQQQQNNRHQPTSAASTPGQLSSAANFWASGSGEAKYNHGSSLFIKDDAGLGGSWVGWSTGNRAPTRREHEEPDQLELDMEVAMEDDSDPEDQMTQEAINAQLDGAMSQDRNDARLEAEDSLARIAQAMTLLSLAPAGNPPQIQYTTGNSVSNNNSTGDDMDWPPHPTPESLLRESLRQSFEALRILKELDKKFVMGGVEARQKPVASPISRRHSLRHEEEEGKTSVVDVLRSYERAVEGVKSAQEVLKWAEHWIKEEGDRTRERLLKS
ncbi:hypothetical protein DFH27DRAFT_521663 [Peziza echinospora]|nr:hypothetical protein DFH27DRAFT_521663 [Peziza echinospora]